MWPFSLTFAGTVVFWLCIYWIVAAKMHIETIWDKLDYESSVFLMGFFLPFLFVACLLGWLDFIIHIAQ